MSWNQNQVRLHPQELPSFAGVPQPWAVHQLQNLPGFALSGLQAPVELKDVPEAAAAAQLLKEGMARWLEQLRAKVRDVS